MGQHYHPGSTTCLLDSSVKRLLERFQAPPESDSEDEEENESNAEEFGDEFDERRYKKARKEADAVSEDLADRHPESAEGLASADVQEESGYAPAYVGSIKSFNPGKGWGFIKCDSMERDVIFVRSDTNGGFFETGDYVSFDIIEGPKGPKAVNIQVALTATALDET